MFSFIYKGTEKTSARNTEEHFEQNGLSDSYKCDGRRDHSKETVPTKVHSDIVKAFDEASMTALIRLDLPTAFRVIDHPIQLKPF